MRKSNMKKNLSIVSVTCFIVLAFYTIALFLLMYLAIVTSLKGSFDLVANNRLSLPKTWEFVNYADAFKLYKLQATNGRYIYLHEMFLNSLLYSVGCAALSAIVPCIVAFLIAKYNFWFNKVIYTTVIVAMTLPIVGSLPSEVVVINSLGLYNSIFGMWIHNSTYLGMYFLVYYATFKSFSKEYMESAFIDGASHYRVLLSIVLPLVKTTIFAVFILQFVAFWNNYQAPLIYLPDHPTAATGLFRAIKLPSTEVGSGRANVKMAGCMMLCAPILILFIACRNIFMGNLSVGGLKG